MKTKLLFSSALLFAALSFNAQKLYVNVGAGYGLNAYGFNYGESTASGNTTSYTSKNLNLGTGVNFGLRAGYMLNQNLAFELGLGYRMHKSDFLSQSKYTFSTTTVQTTYDEDYSFSMMQVPLSIRLSAGEGKIKYYSRFGVNLGFGGKITTDQVRTEVTTDTGIPASTTTDTEEESWEYKGGLSVGVAAGLGVIYHFNDKMGLSFEVNGNAQGFAPKTGVMTKNTYNGTDNLSNMDKADKEVEYVSEYSYDSSATYNPAEPTKQLKFAYPLNTWGFNVGFHILLGGGE